MIRHVVVTGTDTGIGKTVFAAGLAGVLGARYWKPVQSGLESETDTETVVRLGGGPSASAIPEVYRLPLASSPHRSAQAAGMEIDTARLDPPAITGSLVIEGAGGVMVPLTRHVTFLDVFARWRLPTVLCARTTLGTINHTLLSLQALRARAVPILGIAFIGDAEPDTASVIAELGAVPILGCLPWLAPLTRDGLQEAFVRAFPSLIAE
jgi:dethiobiotin synthetase